MSDQKNFLLAIIISTAIILGYQFAYEKPRLAALALQQQQQTAIAAQPLAVKPLETPKELLKRDAALLQNTRVSFSNGKVNGTIALKGARLDDIVLPAYRQHVDIASPAVELLSPSGTEHAYFAEIGWLSPQTPAAAPTSDAVWQQEGTGNLTPEKPLTLFWENGAGVRYEITYRLDAHYMLTATTSVKNNSKQAIDVHPFGLIQRKGSPDAENKGVHSGTIGVFDNKLEEIDYAKLVEKAAQEKIATQGWVGIGDKYWLTALVPQQGAETRFRMQALPSVGSATLYQTDFIGAKQTVAAGSSATFTTHFYAGAKEVEVLDDYSKNLNIPLFDRAVNFGMLYFITKPFFYILHSIYMYVGNFGVAIILFTILVRLFLAPLAHKSYKSINALKKLQPQMDALKEQHGDDKMQLHKEIVALYKREKVNPASGCLPVILQIPVFIALYRVLSISLEMRHAPFFGWIKDLSAPDPAFLLNGFGALNFPLPHLLQIGVWPILMGITMVLSQKMNPKPTDPTQQIVFNLLPIIFTFVTATLPAGLAIYWTFNNVLSIIQQYSIQKMSSQKT